MAKALYYRGTAYRKQGKPAQAISDLTTAAWLKGGLSDSDRAQAMEQRQLAYSEAGLGSQAPSDRRGATRCAGRKARPAGPGASSRGSTSSAGAEAGSSGGDCPAQVLILLDADDAEHLDAEYLVVRQQLLGSSPGLARACRLLAHGRSS